MTEPITSPQSAKILRASIWVAIGALIAAALVCVVWVLVGDENGIVGKAFLTVLLLAAFAGVAILETNLAVRRPAWLSLASMLSWVLILLIGAFLIWMPTHGYFGVGAERFFRFILIALIIQGALLHARLLLAAYARHQTTFTTVVTYVTVGLVVILAVMLVLGIIALPGMDMAFVLGSTLVDGRRGGLAALAGIVAGGVAHTAMAALGVGLVLRAVPALLTLMLVAGALGLPVRFAIGPGQQNDLAPACDLVAALASGAVAGEEAASAVMAAF